MLHKTQELGLSQNFIQIIPLIFTSYSVSAFPVKLLHWLAICINKILIFEFSIRVFYCKVTLSIRKYQSVHSVFEFSLQFALPLTVLLESIDQFLRL